MPDAFELHYKQLLRDVTLGLLVPVLGGDINLCGRPRGEDGNPVDWQIKGSEPSFPPTTSELVLCLLQKAIKDSKKAHNLPPIVRHLLTEQVGPHLDSMSAIGLANICQYIQFVDPEILDVFLPDLLTKEYRPTPVHDLLVKLAQYRPDPRKADTPPYPCIVTTCFDQVLEQQLRKHDVKFHLVAFVLVENGGVFQYTPPGKSEEEATDIGTGDHIRDLKGYPVILKLNGGVKPGKRDFAITEDHLIDYLNRQGIKDLLPEMLLAKLTKRGRNENSHLLFMGYGLRHWSLRVILRRIWHESLGNQSKRWTVILESKPSGDLEQRASSDIDLLFWNEYGLKEREQQWIGSLETYIDGLSTVLPLPVEQASFSPVGTDRGETRRPQPPSVRDGVFFSYSHHDAVWLNKLKGVLTPVRNQIQMWDDGEIEPGERWRPQIEAALARASVAVLLVSPHFLSSDFIQKNELQPLLKSATEGGCKILWINVTASLVEFTEIGEYQALHKNPALSTLSEAELGEYLHRIAVKIHECGKAATPVAS